jgi:hypothetical protein
MRVQRWVSDAAQTGDARDPGAFEVHRSSADVPPAALVSHQVLGGDANILQKDAV